MVDEKLEEIQRFVKNTLHFRVTIEELKNPTPETVVPIYKGILKVVGVLDEYLNQLPLQRLPDSELYQDLTILINLTLVLQKILQHLRYSKATNFIFELDDLINPKPKKTRDVLFYLCQYCNFWEEKMNTYHPILEGLQEELLFEKELNDEIGKLKSGINELQVQIQELCASNVEDKYFHSTVAMSNAENLKLKYVAEKANIQNQQELLIQQRANLMQKKEHLPDAIKSMENEIMPNLNQMEEDLEVLNGKIDTWEARCKELGEKEADLYAQLKVDKVVNLVKDVLKLEEEGVSEAVSVLKKIEICAKIRKAIEIKKKETMAMEKQTEKQSDILTMLKEKNNKQLWRLQRQIETRELDWKKAHGQVKAEFVSDFAVLDNKKCKLIQCLEEKEKKVQDLEKEFLSFNQQLLNIVLEDEADWASVIKTVIANILQ